MPVFLRCRFLLPLSVLMTVGALCACLPPLCAQSFQAAQSPAPAAKPATQEPLPTSGELIASQEGELPIILSAPHGGTLAIPGGVLRTGTGLAAGPTGFVTVRDVNTDRLALALAEAIQARMGKKPYYVIAHFQRRYADPNRPPAIATEDTASRKIYDAYHQKLADDCKAVKQTWGKGLVIDIHGQAKARDTIFRGTNNGRTVSLLVQRYGPKAQDGPESLLGLLAARGCKVFPTIDSAASGKDDSQGNAERKQAETKQAESKKEAVNFNGGYIVQTYGGHEEYGTDAIQLEFGGDYTDRSKIKQTAAKLADALAEYARLYLFDKPNS